HFPKKSLKLSCSIIEAISLACGYEYTVWPSVPCPLGCRVADVVAEGKIARCTYDRSCCTCGYGSWARTIRRRDRGHALPLCGLPPRHTVLSLAPGWPVDSITTKSVPSAYLSSDAPRPCDCKARTVRTGMVGSGCQ